jgi:uncharacterized protein (TIGR03435 family)
MQVYRGRNATMAQLATFLGPEMSRTVLDETGLIGRFSFDFWVAPQPEGALLRMLRSMPRASSPTIVAALAAVGLRLEPSTAPLEVLVIDRVERLSQN